MPTTQNTDLSDREPYYTVDPHHTGVAFHRTEADARADADRYQGRVVPATQVAPEVRAEGRDWLAGQ